MTDAELGAFAAEAGATIGKLQKRVADLETTMLQLCVGLEGRVDALESRVASLELRRAALERPMLTVIDHDAAD